MDVQYYGIIILCFYIQYEYHTDTGFLLEKN